MAEQSSLSSNSALVLKLVEILNFSSLSDSPSRILTSSEVRTLLAIDSNCDENNQIRLSELGRMVQLTPSALSQMMRALERYDLISRQAAPEDRRAVIISLTQEGRDHVQDIMNYMSRQITPLVKHLGAEKTEELSLILDDVLEYFKSPSYIF